MGFFSFDPKGMKMIFLHLSKKECFNQLTRFTNLIKSILIDRLRVRPW